jgi:hypothetical protein
MYSSRQFLRDINHPEYPGQRFISNSPALSPTPLIHVFECLCEFGTKFREKKFGYVSSVHTGSSQDKAGAENLRATVPLMLCTIGLVEEVGKRWADSGWMQPGTSGNPLEDLISRNFPAQEILHQKWSNYPKTSTFVDRRRKSQIVIFPSSP